MIAKLCDLKIRYLFAKSVRICLATKPKILEESFAPSILQFLRFYRRQQYIYIRACLLLQTIRVVTYKGSLLSDFESSLSEIFFTNLAASNF